MSPTGNSAYPKKKVRRDIIRNAITFRRMYVPGKPWEKDVRFLSSDAPGGIKMVLSDGIYVETNGGGTNSAIHFR